MHYAHAYRVRVNRARALSGGVWIAIVFFKAGSKRLEMLWHEKISLENVYACEFTLFRKFACVREERGEITVGFIVGSV